ncbi:MAG: leucine-rich repeat domain-containing protein, partial [Paludibacteraceae bacterium]|nr:leucine-rich repeat domain-containing protein [Paludibacteraceae bacterium]
LTSIVIPESVTKIGNGAFSGCTSLTSVEIPNSVTEIGAEAFSGCTSLTSIVIPESVTKIGNGAFSGCTSLTSIEIPESVAEIGEEAFSGCTSLTSIEIPNSVTKIGEEAFSGCINLSNIEIPQSVKSMDYRAFQNCKSLTSIFIPCDLYFYGGGVLLGGCENIESVTFSRRVSRFTYDGYYSYKNLFSDCPNLMSVKMYSAEPPDVQLTNYAFGKRDVMFVLYVPVGCKEKYKNYRVYYNKAVYYYPYENYYIEEFDPEEDPFGNNDGIETIVSYDYDGVIDVYNMSGVKILSTYNKDEIDNLPKGIYVVRAGQKPEKYIVK